MPDTATGIGRRYDPKCPLEHGEPSNRQSVGRKVFPPHQVLNLRAAFLERLNAPSIVETIGAKVIIERLTADGALNATSKRRADKRNGLVMLSMLPSALNIYKQDLGPDSVKGYLGW